MKSALTLNIMKHCLTLLAALLLAPLAALHAADAPEPKPNIISLLADDLGWDDLGCYGHPQIRTPNLDALAADGKFYTSFYANGPASSPTRTAFMTGLFPSRLRIFGALGYGWLQGDGSFVEFERVGRVDDEASTVGGLSYSKPRTYRLVTSIQITGGPTDATNIVCTAPLPIDWPEQQVKLVCEKSSPGVRSKVVRLADKAEMLVANIARVPVGSRLEIERVYEVTRRGVRFKGETDSLEIPAKVRAEYQEFLRSAPGIEVGHAKIKSLHAELTQAHLAPWQQVQAYFDWVRGNLKFERGQYRGAVKALQTKVGDCEDYTALFVALCRLNRIPARSVWIEGHAYAEFFLVPRNNQVPAAAKAQESPKEPSKEKPRDGIWIPCELVGAGGFGFANDLRPILQKGDEFVDTLARKTTRYVPQTVKGIGGPVGYQPNRVIKVDQ